MGIVNIQEKALTNCKCNKNNGDSFESYELIQITANEGYKFDKDKTYYFRYGFMTEKLNFKNDTTLTFLPYDSDIDINFMNKYHIEATGGSPIFKPISITGTFTNCTCNYNDGDLIEPTKDIVIKANKGFLFDRDFKYKENAFTMSVSPTTENTVLRISTNKIDINTVIKLNDDYVANKETINYKIFITGSFENCTCNYKDGETLSLDKNIIITATENYYFDRDFKYKIGVNTYFIKHNETKDELILEVKTVTEDIYFYDKYFAVEKTTKLNGFINIYNPTESEILKLSEKRFVHNDVWGTEIDMFSYITNLFITPFKIPTDLIQKDKKDIILGYSNSFVKSNVINTYVYKLDLGKIHITGKYNNSFDYLNTNCTIHLPFTNSIDIDVNYVIDKDISVTYFYNFYTGDTTINIYSNDILINTIDTNISTTYPYIMDKEVKSNFNTIHYNELDNMYIILERSKPLNSDNKKQIFIQDKIINYSGFMIVDNITINNFNGLKNEFDMISELLKEGVIYNV